MEIHGQLVRTLYIFIGAHQLRSHGNSRSKEKTTGRGRRCRFHRRLSYRHCLGQKGR